MHSAHRAASVHLNQFEFEFHKNSFSTEYVRCIPVCRYCLNFGEKTRLFACSYVTTKDKKGGRICAFRLLHCVV
jgi:hypothetical protein